MAYPSDGTVKPPLTMRPAPCRFPMLGCGVAACMVSIPLTDVKVGSRLEHPSSTDSPMLIHCPTCATSYDVKPSALGATGRSVRCVRCRTVWFAGTPPPEMATGGRGQSSHSSKAAAAATEAADVAPADDWEDLQFEGESLAEGPSAIGMADSLAGDNVTTAVESNLAAQPEDRVANPEPLLDAGARALAMDTTEPPNHTVDTCAPVTMADAPPIAPSDHDGSMMPAEPPALIGFADRVDTFVGRRAKTAAGALGERLAIPGLRAAAVILAAILIGLVGGRSNVVAAMPQMASLYQAIGLPVNLRGLAFEDLRTTQEIADGVPIIVIEGTILNVAKTAVEVPRLRFAVRNGAGSEVYTWTALPQRSILADREQLPFRARLASPPSDGHDVTVRFYNRRDAAGGLR